MESYEAQGIRSGCLSGDIDNKRARALLDDALIAGDLWITTGEPWEDFKRRVGKGNYTETVGGPPMMIPSEPGVIDPGPSKANHYNRLEQVVYLEEREKTIRAHSSPQTLADGRVVHDWTEGEPAALLARLLEPLATGCAPHKAATAS